MGMVIRCEECSKAYRTLEQLEELRDNESICLRCRALVEVEEWDEILSSWEENPDEESEDFDDVEIEMDDEFSHDLDEEEVEDEEEEDKYSREITGLDEEEDDDDLDDEEDDL